MLSEASILITSRISLKTLRPQPEADKSAC